MEITTKYDIGDQIWFIHDNKAQGAKVQGIRISVCDESLKEKNKDGCVEVEYDWWDGRYMSENMLFKTKTELLNSL